MTITDELKAQISSGKISFDPPQGTADRLRAELLGENAAGPRVSQLLQRLALAASQIVAIRISSILRDEGKHRQGFAFDVGNEDVARDLLSILATNEQVLKFAIDEIIFDAGVAGYDDRNKWNYDNGTRHDFDGATLDQHRNHVHLAVTGL